MCAFKISNDAFSSKPMCQVVEGEKLAQFTNSERDIRSCGDSKVHEETYKPAVREVEEFEFLLWGGCNVRVAGENQARFHRCRHRIAIGHVKLFQDFIN